MSQQNKHDIIENLIKCIQYFTVTVEFSSSDEEILIFSNRNLVNLLSIFLVEHAFHQCSQRPLVIQIYFKLKCIVSHFIQISKQMKIF